jgi:RNA polymerase sigma-70 factor (ECF subfamily)
MTHSWWKNFPELGQSDWQVEPYMRDRMRWELSWALIPWSSPWTRIFGKSARIRGWRFCVLRKEEIADLSRAASNVVSPDAMLVSAIRSGDEQAMAQLYERYSPIVYSVALRVLGDTGAAEDVLQEVFMQLWRSPDVFDATRGSLPGWLAVITRNRAIDSLRKRRPETDITDVVVSIEPDLIGGAELSRALEKIREALAGMPAPQRSALEMAFFEGLTHAEISEKTSEPLGTIKTRIRAGLLTLRKAFNP